MTNLIDAFNEAPEIEKQAFYDIIRARVTQEATPSAELYRVMTQIEQERDQKEARKAMILEDERLRKESAEAFRKKFPNI